MSGSSLNCHESLMAWSGLVVLHSPRYVLKVPVDIEKMPPRETR